MITISSKGIQLIKQEEGERLKPYQDSGGFWTIGVGHKILPDEAALFLGITSEKSTDLLRSDLGKVITALNNRITVPLTQDQIDALAGFLFNAGTAAGKTLFSLINNHASPAEIFSQWTSHYITTGGAESSQLKARRIREANLFNGSGNNSLDISTAAVSGSLPLLLGAAALLLLSTGHKKNRRDAPAFTFN